MYVRQSCLLAGPANLTSCMSDSRVCLLYLHTQLHVCQTIESAGWTCTLSTSIGNKSLIQNQNHRSAY